MLEEKNINKIKDILSKLTNKIGYIIGFVSAIITLVVYFDRQETDIKYEVLQNISALDIRESLSDLDIYFRDENLIATNKNIQIYTMKVINSGNQTIPENSYSKMSNFGLKIENGTLIDTPIILSASNKYIKSNMKINVKDQNTIIFPKLTLEPSENYIIKFFILNKNNNIPTLNPIGKIAGVRNDIEIVYSKVEEKESYFKEAFKGNLLIQLLRTTLYFLIGFIIFIIFIFMVVIIAGSIEKIKSKKKVENYKALKGSKKIDDFIFETYINENFSQLVSYFGLLKEDESKLDEIYNSPHEKAEDYISGKANKSDVLQKMTVNRLLEIGILTLENGKIKKIIERKEKLKDFIEYLSEQNQEK